MFVENKRKKTDLKSILNAEEGEIKDPNNPSSSIIVSSS